MRQLSIVVVVLACIAALWWMASGERATPPPAADAREPDTHVARDATPTVAPADATARAELAASTLALAEIPGRCVDDSGTPIAGVVASLRGYSRGKADLDAHVRAYGPLDWRDPTPATTDAEGRFTLRFAPPPPFAFALELTAPAHAPCSARFATIAAGSTQNVGDVTLHAASRMRGRVVDTNGTPVAAVTISVARSATAADGPFRERERASTTSGTDGSFQFDELLRVGEWHLTNDRGARVRPGTHVALTEPDHFVELVLDRSDADGAIDGIVVDESGAPVEGARVSAVVAVAEMGRVTPATTRSTGVFRITRPDDAAADERFALTVSSPQHEPMTTEPIHRYGERDVRLVVRSGLTFEVHARRLADDAPVAEFVLHVMPAAGRGDALEPTSSRSRTTHENGVARVPVRRGKHFVSVVPAESTGLAAVHFVAVEVDDTASLVHVVRLPGLATRTAVVTRSDGSPVVGAYVEMLLAPRPEAIHAGAAPVDVSVWDGSNPGRAGRTHWKRTDERGAAELRGNPLVAHAVRVSGRELTPTVQTDVRLDVATPLSIVIPVGGRLVGRLHPLDAVTSLHERTKAAPAILLRRSGDQNGETFPSSASPFGDGAPVAADGTFVVDRVPPGIWDVELVLSRSAVIGEGMQVLSRSTERLRTALTVADGEQVALALDVSALRPAQLRANVTLDDRPFVGSVSLASRGPFRRVDATTDARGALDVWLLAGTWYVALLNRSGEFQSHSFRPDAPVVLQLGQELDTTIAVRTTTARVRVLRPDGAPAAGALLSVRGRQWSDSEFIARADASGVATVRGTGGDYDVYARIRSLTDDAAWNAFVRQARTGPAGRDVAMVLAGTVTLPATPTGVELRLPSEWEK